MLSLVNVFWVIAYLGIIHLLCIIFSRLSRSSDNNSLISPESLPSHHYPSFEISDNDDYQFSFNHKILPDDGDQFDDFNRNIRSDVDQFNSNSEIPRTDRRGSIISQHEEPTKSLPTTPVTTVSGAATSKYQFLAGRSFSGYIEQPQSASFKVQELVFSDSDFDQKNNNNNNTIAKESSRPPYPRQIYNQNNEEDQAKSEEHIAISEDSSSEEGEEEEVEDVVAQNFHHFNDHQNLKTEKNHASSSSSTYICEVEEEELSSAKLGVSQVKESDISSAENATIAVTKLEEKNTASTDQHVDEEELEISSSSQKAATAPDAVRQVEEETDYQPVQEVEEKISSTNKHVQDAKESEIAAASKTKEEVRDDEEDVVEIFSSEKASNVRVVEEESGISSSSNSESVRRLKGKMAASSSLESSSFNNGEASSSGEAKAEEPNQKSTDFVKEKDEEGQLSQNNNREIPSDSKDLLSDHDFSVSSESDGEENELELQQLQDELIIFGSDQFSPRKLTFDDFLSDSDVFYSLREQDHDQNLSAGRLGFSDSDEEDELDRSFVKGSTTTADVEWLGRSYEDEEEEGEREDEESEEQDYDVLLEHLASVQKLKKEMKSSRRSGLGLPTILEEESESGRLEEEDVMKPVMMMDEKLEHKERIDEIQRYYRRYWEKMRRLDMLCHQSMNAIGFMQQNRTDKAQPTNKLNPWSNLFTSNFCHPNLIRRNSSSDPVLKLYRNLHRDFELVYVGQLCLSWEILKWQHYKSEELQLYDTSRSRRYNQIADEFQKFQVLLQRFTEDETYQGPRIQNYVKNRCSNRTILQVPLLKDDASAVSSLQRMEEGQMVITIAKLTEIIELSTRTFWEFLRADKKDECLLRLTNCQGISRTHLEDPADAELLMNLRTDLQKKERKMRAIVKSGNCIVQKFQKQREEERRRRLRHELVIAQVEMRLVGRVLDMSRLSTDQLLWCHKKLNKVKFVGRIVHVESSSFLLFPF